MRPRRAKQTSGPKIPFVVAAVVGLLAMAPPAQAQDDDDFMGDILRLALAGAVADCSLMVVGGVFAMGNFTYVVNPNQASSKPWVNAGYTIGALNLAAGAIVVGLYANDRAYGKTTLTAGLVNLGIGALDIGLAVWGSQEPTRKDLKVALQPLVLTDAEGSPAIGAGVAVVGW